jgi:hypothetical protein
MTIDKLEQQSELLLLKCVSGSNAYGLNLPTSDIDYKGVFVLSKMEFYGLSYTEQVNNQTNDIVYYELRRFIDLLVKNNPNILELLYTPQDCVIYKHPLIEEIKPDMFLSKLCMQTFAGYAQTQIKRAKGLNKKILNPVDRELKTVIDFCHVVSGQGTLTLSDWLQKKGILQEECGLVSLPRMRDMYALFHPSQFNGSARFKGIISGPAATDISLSSVTKDVEPMAFMHFNKDGYCAYYKDYHEYWEWVEKRNEERYESTLVHGKNYDAKNMMHVFRLLNTAEEIAREKKVNVRRKDRDYLLSIRRGDFLYDDLVEKANDQIARIYELYKTSDLPETPDIEASDKLLCFLREKLYRQM